MRVMSVPPEIPRGHCCWRHRYITTFAITRLRSPMRLGQRVLPTPRAVSDVEIEPGFAYHLGQEGHGPIYGAKIPESRSIGRREDGWPVDIVAILTDVPIDLRPLTSERPRRIDPGRWLVDGGTRGTPGQAQWRRRARFAIVHRRIRVQG